MNLDEIFKALGDQNRLRILSLLLENELCVCEIEKVLGLTQSNVSRHLQVLKSRKIVSYRKTSQWIYYRISDEFCKEYGELCEFLKTKFLSEEPFKSDLEKLKEEKKNGFSCEKATEEANKTLTKS
ncbi:ArsR/SmtB family transcription factor [Anaerocellum danielii]|uniref:Metalloregulator ArsR/SmtB family transcription factor n=1 Tax=Anaerocellum danielii TaxID=1387557 RepID=A0ABZ0TWN6_9FIRM|nr:metalloregulator ArsR/SmtB family transcription factor [Caldicellulosiruptor danielii]WPX07866.1 metalloregulator ArsR/SmtB family transcription factor [Caldicellulosiruptor danielii]